jgi:hypothetical protein
VLAIHAGLARGGRQVAGGAREQESEAHPAPEAVRGTILAIQDHLSATTLRAGDERLHRWSAFVEHLKDIFAEGELAEAATCKSYLQVRQEGSRQVTRSLKASGHRLLDHAGSVSAEAAKAKAEAEYARYHALLDVQPRAVDTEFEKVARQLAKPETPRSKKEKKR